MEVRNRIIVFHQLYEVSTKYLSSLNLLIKFQHQSCRTKNVNERNTSCPSDLLTIIVIILFFVDSLVPR